MPRETFIVNRRGETLAGILTTANRQGDASYESREKRLAIMCHGFMETRDTFILRRLSTALLEAESSGVDAVFRFDFGGNGASEGRFHGFGGYREELNDLEDVVAHFRKETTSSAARSSIGTQGGQANGGGREVGNHSLRAQYKIFALIGHSKGASTVLHYAAAHDDVDVVVSLAARFDMRVGIRERLGDARMRELETIGRTTYSNAALTNRREIEVTMDQYQQRISLDNTLINSGTVKKTRKLRFIHGDSDSVIPAKDAQRFADQFDDFDDSIADARALILEGCGHSFFKHSDACAKIVLDALREAM